MQLTLILESLACSKDDGGAPRGVRVRDIFPLPAFCCLDPLSSGGDGSHDVRVNDIVNVSLLGLNVLYGTDGGVEEGVASAAQRSVQAHFLDQVRIELSQLPFEADAEADRIATLLLVSLVVLIRPWLRVSAPVRSTCFTLLGMLTICRSFHGSTVSESLPVFSMRRPQVSRNFRASVTLIAPSTLVLCPCSCGVVRSSWRGQ